MHVFQTTQRVLIICGFVVIGAGTGFAQKGGSGSAGGAPASAGAPSISSRPSMPSTNASTNVPNSQTWPNDTNRPVFVDGRVVFDDGSPANPDIRVERVCQSNAHLQAHVDSKGRFSFQLGQNTEVDTDASTTSSGLSMPGMGPSHGSAIGNSSGSSMGEIGCEIRASYPGYRSDVYEMTMRQGLEEVHVGTLILHRLANVKGTTVSLTSGLAPKHAQKDYEKGLQFAAKGNFEEAEKHLTAATDLYPKYAQAWCTLGEVQLRAGKNENARHSFHAAIDADNKYVSPYNQLALLAGQENKWGETVEFSRQALDLNPVEFVSAYWYNAVGNYHLKNLPEAEKSARQLVKLDTAHQFPQAENMLANILLQKGDLTEAAVHMRAYLTLVPNAEDAAQVKALLAKADAQKAVPAK